jgi:uncharacterized protein (UPF0548 family)
MFIRVKPSQAAIRNFLACQTHSHFSYPEIGASAVACGPAGYMTDHNRILLGHGEQVWDRAMGAVDTWQMFNMDWLDLCWPDVQIVEGANVAVLIRHFGFWSLNAARIIYKISENSHPFMRYGFAYGTLLEHGESGEERFSVEWQRSDDSVWYDLFAFSKPQAFSARMAWPLARWLQRRFREDSQSAMVRAVA